MTALYCSLDLLFALAPQLSHRGATNWYVTLSLLFTSYHINLMYLLYMDESPKQLIEEVYQSLPTKEGQVKKIDPEYKRNGVANIFMAVKLLGGKRYVKATEYRCKTDLALFIKDLSELYLYASKIIIVMDNLNIHTTRYFYEAFSAAEARELSTKFEFHYIQKHGS